MIQNYGEKYKMRKMSRSCSRTYRLENWSETWLLKFNASKFKVMQIGRKRHVNYHLRSGMDIVNLTETEMEKDFGVWIDKDLKWSHQCRKAASKAMSVLGMI